MKKLILVSSPPACGKTYVSRNLAKELKNIVYLDKDTLIPLSKQIFRVGRKPFDRSSDFFEENVRDYEYEVILDLGFEALCYAEKVLINAPFTRELRSPDYLEKLTAKLAKYNAELFVVWVVADEKTCHDRMKRRRSERDSYKLAHWDEYVKTINFDVPQAVIDNDSVRLFTFYNSSEAEYYKSMHDVLIEMEK